MTVLVVRCFLFSAVQPGEFPGLIPLIEKYMQSVDDCDVDTSCTISQYLRLISDRASGTTLLYILTASLSPPSLIIRDQLLSRSIRAM